MRKRGCHGTYREIHKLGHILDIDMCAASVTYSKINLKEKDVPGAILPHRKVESNSHSGSTHIGEKGNEL